MADLEKSDFPLIRSLEGNRYELHAFFREFLREKLLKVDGRETEQQLHAQIAAQYEALGDWQQAIHHSLEAQEWSRAAQLLIKHQEELLNGSSPFVKNAVERIPPDHFFAEPYLAHIKARALAHLGDLGGAVRTYKEALSQRGAGTLDRRSCSPLPEHGRYHGAKERIRSGAHCLRSALSLVEQETQPMQRPTSAELHWPDLKTDYTSPDPASGFRTDWDLVEHEVLAGAFASKIVFEPMDRGDCRSCGLGLPLVLAAEYRFGTSGDASCSDFSCLTIIYWVFWVFPGLRRRAHLCLGIDSLRLGQGGCGSRWLRQHDVVYDPGSAGFGCGHHRLRSFLPSLAATRQIFSAELLLADHRLGLHGHSRYGVDSPTERPHGNHQPDVAQSLRKPRLQESV